jgi:hypothetical protein
MSSRIYRRAGHFAHPNRPLHTELCGEHILKNRKANIMPNRISKYQLTAIHRRSMSMRYRERTVDIGVFVFFTFVVIIGYGLLPDKPV